MLKTIKISTSYGEVLNKEVIWIVLWEKEKSKLFLVYIRIDRRWVLPIKKSLHTHSWNNNNKKNSEGDL